MPYRGASLNVVVTSVVSRSVEEAVKVPSYKSKLAVAGKFAGFII
jgi:hypothetical protein